MRVDSDDILFVVGLFGSIGVLLLLIGCISPVTAGDGEGYIVSTYYFYKPYCPNCIATAPYISYLERTYNLSVEHVDVTNPANWELAEVWEITAVPTFIIVVSQHDKPKVYRYEGTIAVPKAEYLIAKLMDMPAPKKPYNINMTQLDPMTCAVCHVQKQLPPPSTYSCTACCHTNTKGD